jgi:peptidoglycan/LPS O-acetylase OafA/YrhL
MGKRYEELDALRGVAALTVVFNHFLNVIPVVLNANLVTSSTMMKLLKFSPFHILWAGHEAVVLFFILSGFVLALPFKNGSFVSYKNFVIKRFCRIYIPYIASICTAILLKKIVSRNGIEDLGGWFNIAWTSKITIKDIFSHAILIDDFKNYIFNPVIWSLIHEFRVSLIFPILILFIIKFNWKTVMVLFIITAVAGYELKMKYLIQVSPDYGSSVGDTMIYVFMFVIGALLAFNKEKLQRLFDTKLKNALWAMLSIFLYTYPWWFFNGKLSIHGQLTNEWISTVGACIFVMLSLNSKTTSKFLQKRPLKFLGRISYSLYLFHSIVLLTMLNIFYGYAPVWLVLVVTLPISIIVAWIAYKYLEKPSIQLGRRLTTKKDTKELSKRNYA